MHFTIIVYNLEHFQSLTSCSSHESRTMSQILTVLGPCMYVYNIISLIKNSIHKLYLSMYLNVEFLFTLPTSVATVVALHYNNIVCVRKEISM